MVTEAFKEAVLQYLQERAKADELFAVAYAKLSKNFDDCITYIVTEVKKMSQKQKSSCIGCTSDEIFGMAVHYYNEDNIEIGTPLNQYQVGMSIPAISAKNQPIPVTKKAVKGKMKNADVQQLSLF